MQLEIRALTTSDIASLSTFECHQQNRWTKQVQRTIRHDFVDLISGKLEDVVASAIGQFDEETLVGVAAFSTTEHFEVLALAIAASHQGNGYATQLKRHILEHATDLGYAQVFSLVHRANHPMLAINYRLAAWVVTDTEDPDYNLCIINV